ncbi:S41 family peptidase [Candidatus Parcubacteria bacterium]|jgi:C-terminal peptidase prc|nr:S41 family peptidase [Candidatus Parcubacteria bacterium]MBT7228247.1 S41 family peptidase [Candidatus Parcubacteria bacterium]
MKKLFTFLIVFCAVFFYAQNSQAATIIIGWDPEVTKERYAGSILVEDTDFDKNYWYIDPETHERYSLEDGIDVSRLLKTFGVGIHNKDLESIAIDSSSTDIDYELSYKKRGQFLLQVEENGEAWYVNPLDNRRHLIQNGKKGLDTLKALAIDMSSSKLKIFPVTENKNFIETDKDEFDFENYWELYRLLQNNYYQADKADDKTLFYGSLKGMADSLEDPYTEFFTPKDSSAFKKKLSGGSSVQGIGAMVETLEDVLMIISPLNGSPAQKAGLQAQDQIWIVDDVDIRGFTLDDAVALIKGEAGTTVILEIYRPSTNETFKVSIIREEINLPNVESKKLDNNIAYIKINIFSINLKNEFDSARAKVVDGSTDGLIIDLRNNPGGYTNSAVQLADYWLPEGALIMQEKFPEQTFQYTSRIDREINIPTIILVNEGSASASEIFTSALDENNVAQVVGQTTFGKGTGQSIQNFPDGSALKFTVFEWLTSDSKSLQDVGLVPDYVVENTLYSDEQLKKAKELLR